MEIFIHSNLFKIYYEGNVYIYSYPVNKIDKFDIKSGENCVIICDQFYGKNEKINNVFPFIIVLLLRAKMFAEVLLYNCALEIISNNELDNKLLTCNKLQLINCENCYNLTTLFSRIETLVIVSGSFKELMENIKNNENYNLSYRYKNIISREPKHYCEVRHWTPFDLEIDKKINALLINDALCHQDVVIDILRNHLIEQ